MVEENHNLIYSFLNKYNLSVDDYYDLAAIGLCNAAMDYDSDRCKYFSVYAYECMYSSVFIDIRRNRAKRRIPKNQILYYQSEMQSDEGDSISFMDFIPSNLNVEDDAISKIVLNEFFDKLKDRDRRIFSLFCDGYKQHEIGKIVGCAQSQVARTKKKLYKFLEK